jgi:hypothetical protein
LVVSFTEHQLLPDLDIFSLSATAAGSSPAGGSSAKKKEESDEDLDDNLPLFYQ